MALTFENVPVWNNPVMTKVTGTLPTSLFWTFQCTFAIITAAIITGSAYSILKGQYTVTLKGKHARALTFSDFAQVLC